MGYEWKTNPDGQDRRRDLELIELKERLQQLCKDGVAIMMLLMLEAKTMSQASLLLAHGTLREVEQGLKNIYPDKIRVAKASGPDRFEALDFTRQKEQFPWRCEFCISHFNILGILAGSMPRKEVERCLQALDEMRDELITLSRAKGEPPNN